MKPQACVTVVIPCYKCANTIERAVDSIFNQTLQPKEVILVDDASPDQTLEKLHEIKKKYSSEWIKIQPLKHNKGPGTARNIGWNLSTQPYIAFLDSDDSWHPQKIEIQYNWMKRHPSATLTADSYEIPEENKEIKHQNHHLTDIPTTPIKKHQLLISNRISTPCVMLKRETLFRFKEEKKYSEDYLLWCEIIFDNKECYKIETPLTYLHKPAYGKSGLSSHIISMGIGELETFYLLYKSSAIGFPAYIAASAWSAAKLARRIAFGLIKK